jgi:histidine triad (HIT) family protein
VKSCVFCAIARGETEANIVADDGAVFAFLDRAPLLPGHTLVVPREHADTLDELPEAEVGPLFRLVRRVSRAQQRAFGADGTFTGINTRVSQSVPHLHAHVVPRREGDGLFRAGMVWARKRYKDGEAEAIAAKLRDALAQER